MIRLWISSAVCYFSLYLSAFSQHMGKRVVLPLSIQSGVLEWVDFDNDGFLDVMLLSKDQTDKAFLNIVKTTADGSGMSVNKSIPIISYQAYRVVDYNRDNKMDVLISGITNTVIYVNRGNLNFEEKQLALPPFSLARFADLDSDALPELIVSGESDSGFYLRILKQQSEFNWRIVHDSIRMKCSSLETFDADGDGDIDLFVSGQFQDDSVMSGFLMNETQFYLKPKSIISQQGNTSTGDINNDGFFDVVLMGNEKNGQPYGKKYQGNATDHIIENLPVNLTNAIPFIADFDFDGTADIFYEGIDSFSNMSSEIWFGDQHIEDFPYYYQGSKFGDFDHDGKPDAISMELSADANTLYLIKNVDARINLAPSAPKNAIAIPIFDRLFMYWQKAGDDHTSQVSLTYDLVIQGYQAGEFDLVNEKRLTVSHGNNGTSNFKLFKKVNAKNLKYSIQAVDNSFHAGSLCVGDGRSVCPTEQEVISVCSNNEVKLNAPPEVLWFSFAKGYLGKGSEFNFITQQSDTVFYFNPSSAGCASVKIWSVKVDNPELKVQADQYKIVKGSEVELHVEGAERYVWTPDIGLNQVDVSNPIASPLSTIQYTVTGYNAGGCSSTATVTVTVEETSFIPTLFSPNDDGKNDELKIYGLSTARNFTFSVFNREGAVVYKTSDIADVVNQGWDGTKNGIKQPTGVYFWKVRGESSTGKILLNGKDSGSVVLIR